MIDENAPRIKREPYGVRSAIRAVKDVVSLQDYLQDQGVEVKRNRARCIVHNGDNPESFSINPEKQLWHCFRCDAGGDLLDLAQAVEGGEAWEAMLSLALRFNVELPTRPPQWKPWQNEKAKRRHMILDALADSYQRRLYRVFGEHLREIEDPKEYEQEATLYFHGLRPVAVNCATHRMQGGEHE